MIGANRSSTSAAAPFSFRDVMTSGDGVATFLRGAGGTLGIKVASAGLLFLSQVVFARLLGVESYGIYVLAYAWLNILLLPARQGFDLATVRFVSEYKSRREWGLLRGFLCFSVSLVLATSFVIAVALALGAWLLRARLGEEALWAFWFAAATLPVFAFLQIRESAVRGMGVVVRPQFIYVLSPALLIVGLVVAVTVFGMTPTADLAMAIYLMATVACLAGIWLMARRVLAADVGPGVPATEPDHWIGASFAMMFLMSFGPMLSQVSIVVLGAIDGNEAAGQYGAAARISNIVLPFIAAQNVAIQPMVADLLARGDRDQLQRITRIGVRLVFVAALSVTAVTVAFGPWILGLLGEGFVAAYPMLVILMVGNLAFAVAGPASMLLNMSGHHGASARILALSAGLGLALLAMLVPAFGAIGAAVATALTMAIWCGLMAWAAWRRLGIRSWLLPGRTVPPLPES